MNQHNHNRILTECLNFLSSNGTIVTKSVEKIIHYFFSTDRHIAHLDIEKYALKLNLPISSEDIRKTLDLLVEYGFACKKYFTNNKLLYEHLHLGEHHDHMYCMKCGKIIEFFSPAIEDLQISEAGQYGFHAFSHKMQIKGLCDDCFGAVALNLIPLTMVQEGGKFQVIQVGPDNRSSLKGVSKRLMDMGLVKGCIGVVIRNGSGGIVLNIKNSRIAIGKGQGMKVMVLLKN